MLQERQLYQKPCIKRYEAPRVEQETTPLFNILAEVELAQRYLDSDGNLPENIRLYLELNERTQILEATTQVIHTTHQYWDQETQELTGYGLSMRDLTRSGIENAQRRIAENGHQFAFELPRTIIEAHQVDQLETDIASGLLDENDRIVISPYPEEADKTAADEIGYFTDTRVFMVRIYNFDKDSNILTTTQIQLENSNPALINELISQLKPDHDMTSSPTQILATDIYADRQSASAISLAKMYDDLLEKAHPNNQFFLGAHTKEKTGRNYDNLQSKTQTVENDTKQIINDLVELDIQMARSLDNDSPTNHVQELILQALSAKNENGLHDIKDQSKRHILSQAQRVFTREAATVLKDYELKKAYILVKSIAEEEEAEKVFGKTHVQTIREHYYTGVPEEIIQRQLSEMGSYAQFVIRFCGGSITNLGYANPSNAFDLPFSTFRNIVSGGSERKFVKNCGECGKQINAVIGKGYKCTCGGVYEGC